MKIKVKSWEDVEKTFNPDRETDDLIFLFGMEKLCGTILDVKTCANNHYKYITELGMVFYLHPTWCDVVEEENTISNGNKNTFTTNPEEPEIIKETREQIKVMQAFIDGKYIESKRKPKNWVVEWNHSIIPAWNWQYLDYRVKEEPQYRPYTLEEFLVFVKEGKDYYVYEDENMTLIGKSRLMVDNKGTFYCHRTPEEFLKICRWEDGSKCGVMI